MAKILASEFITSGYENLRYEYYRSAKACDPFPTEDEQEKTRKVGEFLESMENRLDVLKYLRSTCFSEIGQSNTNIIDKILERETKLYYEIRFKMLEVIKHNYYKAYIAKEAPRTIEQELETFDSLFPVGDEDVGDWTFASVTKWRVNDDGKAERIIGLAPHDSPKRHFP